MKKEKGITLTVLIITVIILLILAGVAISALGNSGLFSKSKDAVNRFNDSEKNEQERLNEYINKSNQSVGGNREEESINEEFKFKILIQEGDKSFTLGLPMRNSFGTGETHEVDLEVDWGDGSAKSQVTSASDGNKIHSYGAAGEYVVSVKGKSTGGIIFNKYRTGGSNVGDEKLIEILTGFPKSMEIISASMMFSHCENLAGTIPEDLFKENPEIKTFDSLFYMCSKLEGEIPEKLFETNVNATAFNRIFYNCVKLTGGIPKTLFENNINATNFAEVFAFCSGLTGDISEELFENNVKAANFESAFLLCSKLTGNIPETLFVKNVKATSFYQLFYGCTGIVGNIPEKLFFENQLVTNFNGAFRGCKGLTGNIPENLFVNNANVFNFGDTFKDCTGLTGAAPKLWERTNVSISGGCFTNCKTLTNFATIPTKWK